MIDWKDKKVLVTGHLGLIGKELYEILTELGAKIYGIDKNYCEKGVNCDNPTCGDLTYKRTCEYYLDYVKPDYVFHLAGIKGNPKMTKERPVDFMGPMLQFDTNMILAAQKYGVKKFLYTSSIAVENPQTDRFPAHAKKTGEELIHAMRVQYPKGTEYCIVRPANVYGRYDNFENPDAMVITSLISKAIKEESINIWGDGSHIRDFINAKDVAKGMIDTMEQMPFEPVHLCSGYGVTIKQIAEIISRYSGKPVKYLPVTGLLGDKARVMRPTHKFIENHITIEDGIKEVIDYVRKKDV